VRYALAWRGEHVYYADGEPINGSSLYRVRVEPRPWRAAGSPEKLASFAGVSLTASVSSRGRMVLPLLAAVPNVWSARLRAATASAGALEQVTADSNGKGRLTVAADGSLLAYTAYGPPAQGNVEVRVRDIASGRESLIAGTGKWPYLDPVLSADGSRLAYSDAPGARAALDRAAKHVTYVVARGSSTGRAVCDGCTILAFFPDPAEALVEEAEGRDGLVRRRLEGGGETPLVRVEGLQSAALSPDGRRLAFTLAREDGTAALYETDVARLPGPPESWTLVAEDRRLLGSTAWSPDGALLYYVSQRDGSPCVWAQRVASDGGLAGPATAALHLHSGKGVWGRSTRIGLGGDRLFLLTPEARGDIWSIELGE
jgi:Tol biopolymer transport system component